MNRFLPAGLLATVSFLVSCNSDDKEPDYPIEPYIESANLNFVENGAISDPDELNLSFYFRDGDMDLGLDYEAGLDSPYHARNFFLENNGELSTVGTKQKYSHLFLNVPPDQNGKLVTVRTQEKSNYNFLPEFSCPDYRYDTLYISGTNKEIFDETYNLIRTINNPEVYVLLDTFYYEVNENHYNILIDYLVKQSDGSFIEFDWQREFCSSFDGRFQFITGIKKGMTSESGPFIIKGYSSKEGEFKYRMKSTGFKTLFDGKTLKLRIKIKDRALHDSNTIETNEIQIQ